LGQKACDWLRIVVAGQKRVEDWPKLNCAATHIEWRNLEGHDMVVPGKAEFTERLFG
jgi:hypothetical protein